MYRTIYCILFFCIHVIAYAQNEAWEDPVLLRKVYDQALTKGKCYEDLRYLCKHIGGRLSGSDQLERAVIWAKEVLYGIADTVYLQEVAVPNWFRGEESASFIESGMRKTPLNICALGGSVGTAGKTIIAKVIEVKGLQELSKLPIDSIKGKIVFYNRPMDPRLIDTFDAYRGCVDQRSSGAVEAASLGAIAVIVRSMSQKEDDFPHTGVMHYKEGISRIPAAAISIEDANWLSQKLGKDRSAKISLKMDCWELPDKPSYNVVAEIKGTKYPHRYLLVSGHLDSWDNNEGAHDDGAGVVQSIEVLRFIRTMRLPHLNTIRCVLFTNEENGARGAIEYARAAKEFQEKHLVAIESDRGGFSPRGFSLEAISRKEESAIKKLVDWAPYFEPYGVHHFFKGYSGVDVTKLKEQGTVCIGLVPDSQRYFDHHHAATDVFESVNKRELELGAAAMTALILLIDKYGIGGDEHTAE